MLTKLSSFATNLSTSGAFTGQVEKGSPAAAAAVEQLAGAFAALGHTLPASLAELYRAHDGFTVRWIEKQPADPDRLTSGDFSLPPIDTMLQALRYAPEDFALFDYVSETHQVGLRVGPEGVNLWYYGEDLERAALLPLSVNEYLMLADECRGLQPWQEVVVTGNTLDAAPREKFFADISRLFPDANAHRFAGS